MLSLARKFLGYVVPGVVKPMRVLWNEVIGFLFLSLAAIGCFRLVPVMRQFDGGPESLFRLLLTGIFTAIMLTFGVSSFLRARRISRT
jgi:hypothetical protein